MKTSKKQIKKDSSQQHIPIVSRALNKDRLLELIYSPWREVTALTYWDGSTFKVISSYPVSNAQTYIPIKASNNLIKHGVLKLPSYAEAYGSKDDLINDIRSYIRRYVDLEPEFETVAVYYVLLTWVYDSFRELPYLRLIGDYGTGKTRFLQIIGSICYKPIFASGASTVSPIFHSLNSFRGTLVLDEADFKFSDAKSEITKILNNGNVKGFPVLRCEGNSKGEYNPRAFHVFGPKILATRHHYTDPALESRLITSASKAGSMRKDIPINLPDSCEDEARALRNKLLMFRFKNWQKINPDAGANIHIATARTAQVFRPLLAMVDNDAARAAILTYAQKSQSFLKAFRSHSCEEQVLSVIARLMNEQTTLSIKAITQGYRAQYGKEHLNPITPKWIGGILRSKLHLSAVKRQGVYILLQSEMPKINALLERYSVKIDSSVSEKPAI